MERLLLGGICIGIVLGTLLSFFVWQYVRIIRLKNEYIASLDDKQARKYLELRRKLNLGID